MEAMNNEGESGLQNNRSLSLDFIYQGATGNANFNFEEIENEGIQLPAEQNHNAGSPKMVIVPQIPIEKQKDVKRTSFKSNPYEDNSEDFEDQACMLKGLKRSIEKEEE